MQALVISNDLLLITSLIMLFHVSYRKKKLRLEMNYRYWFIVYPTYISSFKSLNPASSSSSSSHDRIADFLFALEQIHTFHLDPEALRGASVGAGGGEVVYERRGQRERHLREGLSGQVAAHEGSVVGNEAVACAAGGLVDHGRRSVHGDGGETRAHGAGHLDGEVTVDVLRVLVGIVGRLPVVLREVADGDGRVAEDGATGGGRGGGSCGR